MLRAATAAHQAGEFAQAEALYRNVLKIDAKQSSVLLMLGILHAQCGNYSDAEQLLRDALRLNPNNAMQVIRNAPGTIHRPKIIANADTNWPLLLVFCQHD